MLTGFTLFLLLLSFFETPSTSKIKTQIPAVPAPATVAAVAVDAASSSASSAVCRVGDGVGPGVGSEVAGAGVSAGVGDRVSTISDGSLAVASSFVDVIVTEIGVATMLLIVASASSKVTPAASNKVTSQLDPVRRDLVRDVTEHSAEHVSTVASPRAITSAVKSAQRSFAS